MAGIIFNIQNFMLPFKKFLLCLPICLLSSFALSAPKYVDYYDSYDSSHLEGSLLGNKIFFKMKLTGIRSKSKDSGLPDPSPINGTSLNSIDHDLVANGFGGELSSSVFFSEYFASEIGLGFHAYRTKQEALNNVGSYYGSLNYHKNINIYSVPFQVIFQYYIAPFGGITPYVGLGYGTSYFFTHNKSLKVKPLSLGPIAQVGLDLWAQDNTAITFEIKKQFLRAKVFYKSSYLETTNDVPVKVKLDPTFISLGITYKF
ncbi:OmpW/AlkL family protein [Candidatus Phycorickettsia trachydisci]|nr:OmpW family outer membrane protein [Candidatus Phycorickettsia trachydisci]